MNIDNKTLIQIIFMVTVIINTVLGYIVKIILIIKNSKKNKQETAAHKSFMLLNKDKIVQLKNPDFNNCINCIEEEQKKKQNKLLLEEQKKAENNQQIMYEIQSQIEELKAQLKQIEKENSTV